MITRFIARSMMSNHTCSERRGEFAPPPPGKQGGLGAAGPPNSIPRQTQNLNFCQNNFVAGCSHVFWGRHGMESIPRNGLDVDLCLFLDIENNVNTCFSYN